MGWVQILFRPFRTREAKRRPWVSPQFLGLATGLSLLAAGAYVWVQTGEGPGLGTSPPEQHAPGSPTLRDYVGYPDLVALQADADVGGCNLDCRVLRAWYEWESAHPGIEIVSRTPVYDAGVLVGYWVDYRAA